MIDNVMIVGAGSLGTSLAQIVSTNVRNVAIYARRPSVVNEINSNHRNPEYFPSVRLNDNITAISTLGWDCHPEIIFFCVPSSVVREVSSALNTCNKKSDLIMVSTAKGIEYPSLKRMSQIIYENCNQEPVIFSGPIFADEIIMNDPTAVTIAGRNPLDVDTVCEALSSEYFIVERSEDALGTEFCNILKNVYSIGFGLCEGMGINENAKYAIFTRSFQEMKEIVKDLGGNPDTVDLFCGFGDLALTSASRKSRNYTLGLLYGKKIVIDESSSGILFEGKKSILAMKQLSDDRSQATPVLDFIYSVVIDGNSPRFSFSTLWNTMRMPQ